mmetsp:Transcript_4787/g.9718  ORF Transcript_4787/g.9718 Transcript_4787/m.9718 type:complete len:144 (+) Transcript_4787:24-455(+)
MGASSSGSREAQDEEFGLQDDVFPWFHIVQWCSEDAQANAVFRWDLSSIQQAAETLTQDVETFLHRCPDELPKSCGFSLEDDKAFAEWAAALLEWSGTLRQVRYRLVPGRIKEEVFWSRYFAGLRAVVRRDVFGNGHADPDGI